MPDAKRSQKSHSVLSVSDTLWPFFWGGNEPRRYHIKMCNFSENTYPHFSSSVNVQNCVCEYLSVETKLINLLPHTDIMKQFHQIC